VSRVDRGSHKRPGDQFRRRRRWRERDLASRRRSLYQFFHRPQSIVSTSPQRHLGIWPCPIRTYLMHSSEQRRCVLRRRSGGGFIVARSCRSKACWIVVGCRSTALSVRRVGQCRSCSPSGRIHVGHRGGPTRSSLPIACRFPSATARHGAALPLAKVRRGGAPGDRRHRCGAGAEQGVDGRSSLSLQAA